MTDARPFASVDALLIKADECSTSLQPDDWLEAFRAHPRIGESAAAGAGRPDGSGGSNWAAQEQAGMRDASETVRKRLAEANRQYEARFGYIFIVCATGRSAGEMLSIVEERLAHDHDRELRVAAEEQRKITRLRLEKLLEAPR